MLEHFIYTIDYIIYQLSVHVYIYVHVAKTMHTHCTRVLHLYTCIYYIYMYVFMCMYIYRVVIGFSMGVCACMPTIPLVVKWVSLVEHVPCVQLRTHGLGLSVVLRCA